MEHLVETMNRIERTQEQIASDEKRAKYGTFLDSKKDIVELYFLFMVFGVNASYLRDVADAYDKKYEV